MKMINKFSVVAFLSVTVVLLGLGAPEVAAYPEYSSDGQGGNGCFTCHGDFNSGTYVSMVDGQNWGTDLMSGHKDIIIGGANDCGLCHTSPGRSPVFLNSSDGGRGLAAISCLGCHGRAETEAGGAVTGAGLRQHHYNNSVTVCANCHTDANPAMFTTVGEDVLPPYYASPGDDHPNLPDSPCNEEPDYPEDILGVAGTGLDNDGDGVYDESDPDCSPPTGIGDHVAYSVQLHQNFPNPFNPTTTIRFVLEQSARIRLDVFSTDGKLVRTLAAREFPAGVHDIPWNGRDWAGNATSSGVYFYRLISGEEQLTKRMVLLK